MNNPTPAFDWHLVPALLAALERRSLLGAAKALGLSQPTLGRQLAQLEKDLGVVLFERTPRGLIPTAQALALEIPARQMADAAATLARLSAGAESGLAGPVRIAASQPVAFALLPPVLARLRERHPAITPVLVVDNHTSQLLSREADIALRQVQPREPQLLCRRVGDWPVVAVAHRGYLARRGCPVQLGDLMHHDLICGDAEDAVLAGLARGGVVPPPDHIALRTDDLVAGWQAVRAGLGIGFVAVALARSDPQVQVILPALPLPRFPVWLVAHRELHTSARIRAVMDFLAEALPPRLQGLDRAE